ncbi:MAG: Uncharacterised protein [SAR116 cluster bacterium]|nr:MAG: Uncharacterised protein [SAR116 cluster bacterium]
MRAVMIVTNGAQHQPAASAFQEPGDQRHHHHGTIGHQVMRKNKLAEIGKTGQHRHADLRQAVDRLADQGCPDKAGQASAKNGQRKARCHLICCESQNENAKQAGSQHAGDRTGENAKRKAATHHGNPKGGHRPHQHHAFDAEIQNTTALDDQFADGGIDKRHRGHQNREDQIFKHRCPPLRLRASPRREAGIRRGTG